MDIDFESKSSDIDRTCKSIQDSDIKMNDIQSIKYDKHIKNMIPMKPPLPIEINDILSDSCCGYIICSKCKNAVKNINCRFLHILCEFCAKIPNKKEWVQHKQKLKQAITSTIECYIMIDRSILELQRFILNTGVQHKYISYKEIEKKMMKRLKKMQLTRNNYKKSIIESLKFVDNSNNNDNVIEFQNQHQKHERKLHQLYSNILHHKTKSKQILNAWNTYKRKDIVYDNLNCNDYSHTYYVIALFTKYEEKENVDYNYVVDLYYNIKAKESVDVLNLRNYFMNKSRNPIFNRYVTEEMIDDFPYITLKNAKYLPNIKTIKTTKISVIEGSRNQITFNNLINNTNYDTIRPQIKHNIEILETISNSKATVYCDIYCKETIPFQHINIKCSLCNKNMCWKCMLHIDLEEHLKSCNGATFEYYNLPKENVCLQCMICNRDKFIFHLEKVKIDIIDSKSFVYIGIAGNHTEHHIFIDQYGITLKKILTKHDRIIINRSNATINRSVLDSYVLCKFKTIPLNIHQIFPHYKNINASLLDFDSVFSCVIIKKFQENRIIDIWLRLHNRLLLKCHNKIKKGEYYCRKPKTFHLGGRDNKINELSDDANKSHKVTQLLNKANLIHNGEGIAYDINGNATRDVLNIMDICENQEERDTVIQTLLMVQLVCILCGFNVTIPDCIGFLLYYNRDLCEHIDYPFFMKFVILIKLYESSPNNKSFGWGYSQHNKKWLLKNMVIRHLKPGDLLMFFGPLSLLFDHGVSKVDGIAKMMTLRWESLWSKKLIYND